MSKMLKTLKDADVRHTENCIYYLGDTRKTDERETLLKLKGVESYGKDVFTYEITVLC